MESIKGSSSNGNNVSVGGTRPHISEEVDRISYLPNEVQLHILYFLPLKYWIIMSAVSKPWKYLWTQMSSLNLDEPEIVGNIMRKNMWCPSCNDFPSRYNPYQCLRHIAHAARMKFAVLVDRMLLFHSGCTINNFRLSFRYDSQDEFASRITKWVHFSMTSNIKELELKFCEGMPINYYEREGLVVRRTNLAPPYALSCHSFAPRMLKTLTLNFCKFKASSFGVFGCLQNLSLIHVDVLDCSVGNIVSKCPVLEDLSLEYCFIPDKFFVCQQELKIKSLFLINCMTDNWMMFSIDIITPNLLNLIIEGVFLMSSSIKKATQLVDVTINIKQRFADHAQGSFLASLLTDLNHSQTLALSTWCIQVLPTGDGLLGQLPVPLQNLKHLSLRVGLVKQDLPGLSCLLRSCPKLENLALEVDMPMNVDWDVFRDMIPNIFEFEVKDYWESKSLTYRCLQNCLKEVKMYGFDGKSTEMQLAKFLLQNATVLERFDVFYYGLNSSASPLEQVRYTWYQFNNLRMLKSFPRSSAEAQLKMYKIQNASLNIVN